jgi:DNA-binding winged helix-turn-helix (wHTH) protein
MHIAILASSSEFADKVKDSLAHDLHRYSLAGSWSEIASTLLSDRPDLVIAERASFGQIPLLDLTQLALSGKWPPLLITGPEIAHAARALISATRLTDGQPPYYEIGSLRIDTRRKRATIGDRWVALPPIQYRLLLALARHEGEVVNAQELLRTVWGYEASTVEARELVKVHIRQIRRRLGLDPEQHHYIRSVRGFGYVLAPPDDESD